jgi:leucyl-tRNA synthetase
LPVIRLAMESLTLLLSPIVPHFAEELWGELGHDSSVLLAPWPQYRDDALVKEELLIVIQVNGKLRSRFQVAADTDEETIKEMALSDERVQNFIEGQRIKKVIVVKNKLVNIVL